MLQNNNYNSIDLIKDSYSHLKGSYWKAFGIAFLASLISAVANQFNGQNSTLLSLIGIFLGIFVVSIISINLYDAYNCLYRSKNISVGMLFKYDKQTYLRNVRLFFIKDLFIILWSFLFIIPGIIKMCSYSLCFIVASEHPEYSARECITKSRELMDGHKAKLFFSQILLNCVSIICYSITFVTLINGFFEFIAANFNSTYLQELDLSAITAAISSSYIFIIIGGIYNLFVAPISTMLPVSIYNFVSPYVEEINDEFSTESNDSYDEIDELLK